MSKSYSAPCGKFSLCMFNMTILSKLHYQCPLFVWLLCTLGSTRQCTPAWSWRPWSWYSLQRTQHFPPPDDYLCVIAQCELHHLTRNMMMLSARNHVRLLTLYNSMSFSKIIFVLTIGYLRWYFNIQRTEKLDPVGSTVRYEMMKLYTASVLELWNRKV